MKILGVWQPHGAITIQGDDGNIFKVNGQRLKIFLDPSHNFNFDQEIERIDLVAFDKFIQNLWKYKNLIILTYSFIYLKI
jgi:hypothetical protein